MLSEDDVSSNSTANQSEHTPAPTLGKAEIIKKFVEKEAPVIWEETNRGIEWSTQWNDSDFTPSSHILQQHIAKADELLTNPDFKTQLKVTALSTKTLQCLHSQTHSKVNNLQDSTNKLDSMLEIHMKKTIRPTFAMVQEIEKAQAHQQT